MRSLNSRYDIYKDSNVIDESTKEKYPDVLSADFSKGVLNKVPTEHIITSTDIDKFWFFMYKKYNMTEKDDLLLHINGIPYLGMLEPGSIIYCPNISDIDNWTVNKQLGEDGD